MTDFLKRWPKCCPKCGRQGMISDSREADVYVRRRYRCKDAICAHRWTTAELLIPNGDVQEALKEIGRRAIRQKVDEALHTLQELL